MSTAVLTDGVILKSVNKIAKKNPEWGDAKVCAEVKKLHQITASGAALRVWRLTKARGAPAAAANDENSTPNTAPAATFACTRLAMQCVVKRVRIQNARTMTQYENIKQISNLTRKQYDQRTQCSSPLCVSTDFWALRRPFGHV